MKALVPLSLTLLVALSGCSAQIRGLQRFFAPVSAHSLFSPDTSTTTVSAATVASTDTVQIRVRLRGADGMDLAQGGDLVAFSLSGGSSTGTFGPVTDLGDGEYVADFTGVLAGTPANIVAVVNGIPLASLPPQVQVVPGPFHAAQSVVSVDATTVIAGGMTTIRLSARDANGNPIATGGRTVAFAKDSGTSDGVIGAVTDHGNGQYSAAFVAATTGTARRITATADGTPATDDASVTVVAAAPTVVQVAGHADPSVAGAAGGVTVTVKDAFGNVVTDYVGTLNPSSSDAQAVLPAGIAFGAADQGTKTITGITLKTAGEQSLTFTDSVVVTLFGSQTAVTVTAAAPDRIALVSQPASITAGQCTTTSEFRFRVEDAYGNAATYASATAVGLSGLGTGAFYASADTTCAGTAYTTTWTLPSGTSEFRFRFLGAAAGAYAVDAAISGITAATANFTVAPAAAAQLVFSQQPTTGTAGAAFSTQPIVRVADAHGNAVGAGTTAVTLALYASAADCAARTSALAANLAAGAAITGTNPGATAAGATNFTDIAVTRASPTASGVNGNLYLGASNGTLHGCSAAVALSGSTATSLAVTGYTSGADACTTQTALVRAVDAYGNDAPAYAGTVAFSGRAANAHASDVLPSATAFVPTTDRGRKSFSGVVFRKAAADHFLRASDGTLQADQTPITVVGCASSKLSVTVSTTPPTDVEAGVCSALIRACRVDAYDNVSAPASALALTTSGRGSGAYYAASNCSGGTTNSPSIPSSNGCVDLYFLDVVSEGLTLGYSATGHTATSTSLNVNGVFNPAVTLSATAIYGEIALADMNGDGIQDAILPDDRNLRIRLGSHTAPYFGANTQSVDRFPIHHFPARVDVGDINGDGKQDVVSMNFHSGSRIYFGTYLGDGAGGVAAQTFETDLGGNFVDGGSAGHPDVKLLDIDGDGDLDAIASLEANHSVALLDNNGAGVFTPVGTITLAAGAGAATAIAVGDLNGDGKKDAVVTNEFAHSFYVCLNVHPAPATAISTSSLSCSLGGSATNTPRDIKLGDIDGDGFLDVALANLWSSNVTILLGAGTGSFTLYASFAVANNPQAVALGDFDGDGRGDVATLSAGQTRVTLLKGQAVGLLGGRTEYATCSTNGVSLSLEAGDFNADAKLDLAGVCSHSASNSRMSVLIGR